MHYKNTKFIIVFFMVLSTLFCSCGTGQSSSSDKLYDSEFFAMDTVIRLYVYAENEASANIAMQDAQSEFLRIADLCTGYEENLLDADASDVLRVNSAEGLPCEISEEICLLMEKALGIAELTDGAFDIAMGVLVDLWDIRNGGYLPSQKEIEEALASCGNDKVEIDMEKHTVTLADGARLDLGGVAKGYAVDKMAAVLKSHGIEHALIDAGGNIFAISGKPDGTPWQVGVRDPLNEGNIVTVLKLADQAAVTSAIDQRFFIADGVRYHHILDRKTGSPADKCVSLTVVIDDSTTADLLSTALFVLGEQGIAENFDKLPACELLLIDNAGELLATDGMQSIMSAPVQ